MLADLLIGFEIQKHLKKLSLKRIEIGPKSAVAFKELI
jgi:hypothetical protein